LTFTIDISYHSRIFNVDDHYRSPRPIAQLEESEWIAGLLIVESMARYSTWKNVFVHLDWPWDNRNKPNDIYNSLRRQRSFVIIEKPCWSSRLWEPTVLWLVSMTGDIGEMDMLVNVRTARRYEMGRILLGPRGLPLTFSSLVAAEVNS
jgi:hypothetical protein